MKKRKKEFIRHAILSSAMKSHTVPLHTTQDMTRPFVQLLCIVNATRPVVIE